MKFTRSKMSFVALAIVLAAGVAIAEPTAVRAVVVISLAA